MKTYSQVSPRLTLLKQADSILRSAHCDCVTGAKRDPWEDYLATLPPSQRSQRATLALRIVGNAEYVTRLRVRRYWLCSARIMKRDFCSASRTKLIAISPRSIIFGAF